MSSSDLVVPRLSSVHWERGRLVELVLSGAPLVVVRAPAGSGKTGLLVEVVNALSANPLNRCILASGEVIEAVPTIKLWEHCATELGVDLSASSAGEAADEVGGEGLFAPAMEGVFRYLANTKENVYLVLDNSSFLTRRDAEFILLLLRTFQNFFVIAASQTRGQLEDTATKQTFDTVIIGPEALDFTPQEVEQYLRHYVPSVSNATIRRVANAGHGNVAMTKAAVQNLVLAAENGRELDGVDLDTVMYAAVGSTLEPALSDPGFATFLFRTSVVDTFTEELAETILGQKNVGGWLKKAEEMGVGAWDTVLPGVFSYAPNLLEMLRRLRVEALPARVISDCAERAVRYQLETGDVSTALVTALKNKLFHNATHIVASNPGPILGMKLEDLRRILRWVPESIAEYQPELGCLVAASYGSSGEGRAASLNLLSRSASTARSQRDRTDPLRDAMLYATEGLALRKCGRIVQAYESARKSQELLSIEMQKDPANSLPLAEFTAVTNAATLLTAGAFQEALEPLMQVAEWGTSESMRVFANAHLAAAAALAGDMFAAERAARLFELGAGFAEKGSLLTGSTDVMMEVFRVGRALERFDLEAAEMALNNLVIIPEADQYAGIVSHLQAMIDLLSENASEGLVRLQASRSRRASEGLTSYAAATYDYAEQLLKAATGEVVDLAEFRNQVDLRTAPAAQLLVYSRGLCLLGRPAPALQMLSKALQRNDLTVRIGTEAVALQAAILTQFDADQDLKFVIEKLVSMLVEYGLRTPLALLSDSDATAIIEAGERVGVSEIKMLFDEVQMRPDQPITIVTLTKRERQILFHLDSVETLKEIAETLYISENTVRTHVKSIYKKLGVSKRSDAVAVGGARGLLEEL
ncbi:helix-turn-helix transcriptional regulator [Actinomyces minihominis]|uniref:helix-turn-helix transcriptional regulator n=1 Tax=Actinomyces minihominis TaxID=2002838 RepID=UPI000C0891F4|nr:LuxR C-terminal-related transcriptional regulator [Actinomyces minihominis]